MMIHARRRTGAVLFQFSRYPQFLTAGHETLVIDRVVVYIYSATLCELRCKINKNFNIGESQNSISRLDKYQFFIVFEF